MDRLTRTGQDFENEFCSGCDCVYYGEPNGCNHPDGNCGSYTYFTLVADRLAEYEDTGLSPAEVAELAQAKADGRLVVLPCKVGDTVYRIISYKCNAACNKLNACNSFIYKGCKQAEFYVCSGTFQLNDMWWIGKTVFLTREEAEKALNECEK